MTTQFEDCTFTTVRKQKDPLFSSPFFRHDQEPIIVNQQQLHTYTFFSLLLILILTAVVFTMTMTFRLAFHY
jgi:hypothetical protein